MVLGDNDAASRPVPPPALTVAAVARRLGVASSTLRTWDRRYGLGPSAHTANSHRRYGPEDLARLIVMRRLTAQGVPPAQAAAFALDADVSLEDPAFGIPAARLPEAGEGGLAGAAGQLSDSGQLGDSGQLSDSCHVRDPGRWGRCGGGRVLPLPDAEPAARGLARAAMALDDVTTGRLLREGLQSRGALETWNTMILPVLAGIGQRWSSTRDGVEVEHAFSEAVLGALRSFVDSSAMSTALPAASPAVQRPLLLACAEGDYHTLPLHALAAALAERGVGCRLLGPGLPPRDLVAAVRRSGPSAVFLFARLTVHDSAVLEELPRQRPAPRVIVGGDGWGGCRLPAGVVRVGSLADAVDAALAAVHR